MSLTDDARKALIGRLRRLLARLEHDDAPKHSRVSVPHWRRTHEIVHAERDLSEWVQDRMVRDWDSVKEGKNRGK